MNKLKKHIQENPEQVLELVRVGAVLGLTTLTIISIVKLRQTEATLGAAAFVIRDLGGDPVPLIAAKLIEYSGK